MSLINALRFVAFLLMMVSSARAANLFVDPVTAIDDNDEACSLLEALDNAEQDAMIHRDCPSGARADRLVLTANHDYVLEGPWPGTSSGTPILTDELEIFGNGAVIRRENSGPAYRLFEISGGIVTLDGLMLSGGLSFGSMAGGGAVLVDNADLTIRNSTLLDNLADATIPGSFALGGAIRMDSATVLIEDSLIEDNSAFTDNPEMGGGGIAQFDGQLTIRRSALLNNKADFNCDESSPDSVASTGGALRVEAVGSGGAQTLIEDSTLAGNIGRVGGAIHVVANVDTGVSGIQDVFVQLLRSTVVFNQAPSCGGLIGLGDGVHVEEANGGQGLVAFGNTILHGNGRKVEGEWLGIDCSANSINSDFFSLEGNVIDPDDQCPSLGFDALEQDINAIIDPQLVNNAFTPRASGPAVDLPMTALNCSPEEPDQIGNRRAGGSGQGGDQCDAGAIEFQPVGTRFTLNVNLDGTGPGRVRSTPSAISCPRITCSADYDSGAEVEIYIFPPLTPFGGWSGDCTGTGTCIVTMDQTREVTAFLNAPDTFPLSVEVLGGDGNITSFPDGIDCPDTCTGDFNTGFSVILSQTPAPGYTFAGWGGACDNIGSCNVTMDGPISVSANYEPLITLTVAVSGDGNVTSSPAGIDCPGTCSVDVAPGTVVELTQSPASGSAFDGWTGDCGGDGTCVVTMDVARSVTANFVEQNQLTVSVDGNGSVSSSPAGIDCPGNCSADFFPADKVLLTPEAAPGAVFTGWGGDCTGDGVCVVSMEQDRQVTALFESSGFELRVVLEGAGSGQVVEVPAAGGIVCPGTCSAIYPTASSVVLDASAAAGSTFQSFGGDCQGDSCTVTMDRDRLVRTVFLSADQLFIDSFE